MVWKFWRPYESFFPERLIFEMKKTYNPATKINRGTIDVGMSEQCLQTAGQFALKSGHRTSDDSRELQARPYTKRRAQRVRKRKSLWE
jgi:hypothetical protein